MDIESFMHAQPDSRHLEELDTKVRLGGVTGENSAESILATGRPGLEFFAGFGPAYAKATQNGHDYRRDIQARYDEQQEITFARLRADAEQYDRIHGRLADTVVNIRNIGSSVFVAWQGEAAGSANTRFDDFLKRCQGVEEQFATLAETISVTVDAVDRICFEKAKAVHDLRAETVGGCTPDDIAFLVDFGRRCGSGDVSDDELTRAADLCQVEIVPALCRTNPQVFERVATDVNGWLANVFVPFYEARLAKFDTACKAAADTTNLAWEGLRAALSTVHADHFVPVEPPKQTEPAMVQPASSPGPSVPSGQTNPPPATQPGGSAPVPVGTGSIGGGSGDELAAGAKTLPEGPGPGQLTGASLMNPQHAEGAAPPAVGPASAPGGGAARGFGGGSSFYGGVPFLGAPPGGGDRDRSRTLPLAGEKVFVEPENSRADDSELVIGGAADDALYNEEDVKAAARAEESPRVDLFEDDVEDEEELW